MANKISMLPWAEQVNKWIFDKAADQDIEDVKNAEIQLKIKHNTRKIRS